MSAEIKGAVVYRAWVSSAKDLIPDPATRCSLYEALFELYYTGEPVRLSDPVANAVYTMCKPFIVEDVAKYERRCERNRENAAKRASAPSGSQSLPVAPSGSNSNSKSISNSTSNSTSNSNISVSEATKTERQRFDIYAIMFWHDAANVSEEVQRFMDNYEARGWKNSQGVQIVNPLPAARQWDIKNRRRPEPLRTAYAEAFKSSPMADVRIWTALQSIRVQNEALLLCYRADEAFIEDLERRCSKQLQLLMKSTGTSSVQWMFQSKPN